MANQSEIICTIYLPLGLLLRPALSPQVRGELPGRGAGTPTLGVHVMGHRGLAVRLGAFHLVGYLEKLKMQTC